MSNLKLGNLKQLYSRTKNLEQNSDSYKDKYDLLMQKYDKLTKIDEANTKALKDTWVKINNLIARMLAVESSLKVN